MFRSPWLASSFARVFEPLPPEPIWQWAEKNVWLEGEAAAEAGYYRSAKTPWTRRIQDLMRNPTAYFWAESEERWMPILVSEINEEKSSQSGLTEGVLNGMRWRARYRPCNMLYQIDSQKEAQNIRDRLLPSLQKLGGKIFTGEEDDIKALVLKLRSMKLWFIGSGSSGQAANKQAPIVVCDEVEEHKQEKGDTDSISNAESRKKTANDGLQINISKPKLKSGPIHKAWLDGNQEEFHITCPHCLELQWLTFFSEEKEVPFTNELVEVQDEETGEVVARLWKPLPPGQTRTVKTGRMVFDHCKNSIGKWDRMRILNETYYECPHCVAHVEAHAGLLKDGKLEEAEEYLERNRRAIEAKGRIDEYHKQGLVAAGEWLPTAHGIPGIISQHISDLYSSDDASAWGRLALAFIRANALGRTKLQGFYNHRLGIAFADEASETTEKQILANIAGQNGDTSCPMYQRGIIPFKPRAIILGADVGGNYAKWALGAVADNGVDVAIFDWGEEIDPSELATIIHRRRWDCPSLGKTVQITVGFVDAKYRKGEVNSACMQLKRGRLIPTAGLGAAAAKGVKVWHFHQVPTYPKGFCQLTYNDTEAKDELYIYRIKKKKRRVWFPHDVALDKVFMAEMCAESKSADKDGVMKWAEHPPANHFGDCVKDVITGVRFLTRNDRRDPVDDSDPEDVKEDVALAA